MKIKHIYCKYFKTNYWVLYGCSEKLLFKKIKEELDLDLKEFGSAEGHTYEIENDNERIVLIWTSKKDQSILAHECTHAILFTLSFLNAGKNDEVLAYGIEFLMKEILGKGSYSKFI